MDVSSHKLGGSSFGSAATFLTKDAPSRRDTRKQREFFGKVRRSESAYAVSLRKIAAQIGHLISAFDPTDPAQVREVEHALRHYSNVIRPWARAVAKRMLVDVMSRDAKVWREYSAFLGVQLQQEIEKAPTGEAMWQLLNEQVELITSLPLDAAQRVHELAVGSLYTGARAAELSAEIMRTGEVTKSRANLIARTETGRAATTLTAVRAKHVGSDGYIWVSSHDGDVRPAPGGKNFAKMNTLEMGSHRKLDGTFHRWDDPPVASTKGERAHPGCIYNCRCWASPVLPGEANVSRGSWHSGENE